MKTKTLRQSVTLKASPHEVYEALMNSKKLSQITGSKASISRKVGGKFTAYDGYCTGVNLELIPDKLIVQKWRASDWPNGHYSTLVFDFIHTRNGSHLAFRQSEIPVKHFDEMKKGWIEFYWNPMKSYFEKKK